MPEYLSPGVFVEEVDRGPKPIQGVGTAMGCFIGFTEKAQFERVINGETIVEDLLNKPQLVTNWTQYVERFGGLVQGAYLPHSVYGYFLNGGTRCYVLSVKTIPKAQATLLGSDGKPYITVQAKQAGFDGLRLRVRVDAPEPPKAASANKAKDAEAKDAAPAADGATPPPSTPTRAGVAGGPVPFTITVERQGVGGGWQVSEVLSDVTLQEVSANGSKHVAVTYKNNKASKVIDLLVPEGEGSIDRISPRSQEQTLNIQKRLIAPAEYSDFQGDVLERSGVEGLASLDDITMLIVPDLMTTMPGQTLDLDMVKAVQTMMISHCEMMGDRMAVLDSPPDMNPQEIKVWRMETAAFDSSYAALYYPWIEIMDPVTNRPINVPPSGHMAGVWARSDNTRGVHKVPPANEVVRGVINLTYSVTKGEQDTLNPVGVNCLRAFPGMGYRIWGARTLSSDPAWRYINVRRLFNFIEKSLQLGTMWTVFEPNDQRLWNRIRRDVGNFLMSVYSQGALFGATPSQAFYVKCDEELNPSHQRDLGQLVVEIGIAPVKPAEFVIFRVSQWSADAG